MALIITNRFKKAYQQLPQEIQNKVKKALRLLDEDPRYPSLRVKPIQGTDKIYEGRIDRKYRFSFEFDGDDKILRNVDNHDDCLKNP
jgi:mRNA-degrading endonuclease RelE of RelBE toxin-antitoxin system